jgi:hypothetical protein
MQPTLFPIAPSLAPRDPHAHPADRPRLTGQNAEILSILRRGPASNRMLASVSLKYTSRVSDLRAAGFKVRCERCADGLTVYSLEE